MCGVLHRLADEGGRVVGVLCRHFEQQFVVHREDHSRRGNAAQGGVRVDHRQLEDVRRGALDGHVHRFALGRLTDLLVAAVQLRHQAAPAVQRLHYSRRAGRLERAVDEGAHPREPGEVGVDEFLRHLRRHADVLGQREGRLPVEQRVVHHLRGAAQIVRVAAAVGAEDFQRRPLVEVGPVPERVHQHRIVGEVRQHAELDLRVVGRDEDAAGFGNDRAPDLAPKFGAHRDVLQVRVAAAQPAGGGHRLVEAGVQSSCFRIDQQRQRIDVRALQLHQLTPLQDEARQVVRGGELFEHVGGGGGGLRLGVAPQGRQLQLVEEDARQLLRRGDVERLSRELEDPRVVDGEVLLEPLRLRGQRHGVDLHASPFDVDQYRHERPFERRVDAVQRRLLQRRREYVGQLQGQVGPLASEVQRRIGRQINERGGLRAAAAQLVLGQRLVAQMFEGRSLERMTGPRRIEQVAREHGVESEPAQDDAVACQHDRVELEIVPDLLDACVLQHRRQLRQRVGHGQLRTRVHPRVAHRDVARRVRMRRHGDADDA